MHGFSVEIIIGKPEIVYYLNQTGEWDTDGGLCLGRDGRLEKAIGAIELIINNKIRPLYH